MDHHPGGELPLVERCAGWAGHKAHSVMLARYSSLDYSSVPNCIPSVRPSERSDRVPPEAQSQLLITGIRAESSDRHRPVSQYLVMSVTAFRPKSGENSVNSIQRACPMSDNLGNSNARPEKLVRQIMKEKDPVKFDGLCSELWLVLDERESLTSTESKVGGASTTAPVIPISYQR
jgi:hypothetical protein